MRVIVVDAQKQMRTPRDVRVAWVRPKVPAKPHRKGTRKGWKRRNPPHWLYGYREPTDALRMGDTVIVTPRQYDALQKATVTVRVAPEPGWDEPTY